MILEKNFKIWTLKIQSPKSINRTPNYYFKSAIVSMIVYHYFQIPAAPRGNGEKGQKPLTFVKNVNEC